MRRTLSILALLCALHLVSATPPHTLMLYNVENLFDTIRDPSIDDRAFTPRGSKRWNSERYHTKIANIGSVIAGVADESGAYPSVIVLCEVENREVLEDLVAHPSLEKSHYSIVHSNSRDERGVDVAILYSEEFLFRGSQSVVPQAGGDMEFRGRDIVTMWGAISNEELFIVAAHLPSRLGGQAETEPLRRAISLEIASIVDSVALLRPSTKFIIMGDMNDDPLDSSITESLGARDYAEELTPGDLFAVCAPLYRAGYGTSAYRGEWNLFDNIVVSENLISGQGLALKRLGYDNRYYAQIYKPNHLIQQTGSFKGYPFRTFGGRKYLGGYSDHLPIYIVLER